jgi:hypothetical protein
VGYEWTAPSAVTAVVQSLLEPGEKVVAASPFDEWDYRWNEARNDYDRVLVRGRPGVVARVFRGDGWNLLVLTNRYLRELYVVLPRLSNGRARIATRSALALTQISAVEIGEPARGVELRFTGPDGDRWYSSAFAPGRALATELQRMTLAAASHGSSGDQLAILAELHSNGMLSADEWEQAKALYLGKAPTEQERAADELGHLFALKQAGVLSESEFNMKKWEVLARRPRRV